MPTPTRARRTIRDDGGPDVQQALSLLSDIDHPPNESVEAVAEYLDQGWTFIQGDVMVRFDPQPERRYIEIIWWLPLSLWLTVDGLGVLVYACNAVISEYGEDVRGWTISGLFDAPGETNKEMQDRSTKAAEIHKRWIPSVEITPDTGGVYARGTSTVGKVLAAADVWLRTNG